MDILNRYIDLLDSLRIFSMLLAMLHRYIFQWWNSPKLRQWYSIENDWNVNYQSEWIGDSMGQKLVTDLERSGVVVLYQNELMIVFLRQ